MASVQRLMMYVTPIWLLDFLCRIFPKTAIGLLCHWTNEKNPNFEDRRFAQRRPNFVQVAKKFSKLSDTSILNLLRQDRSLWRLYVAGPGFIDFRDFPYVLLQIIFNLGGEEGRKKVKNIVLRSRMTIGGAQQAMLLEYFSTEMVLDLFEMLPAGEVAMRLRLTSQFGGSRDPNEPGGAAIVAIWLTHWDLRRKESEQDSVSHYWLTQLPADLAFKVEREMKNIEFRRPPGTAGAEQLDPERRYYSGSRTY